ncbi:MAG: hypothetical protein N0E48_06700 [Candidatus Thiodiazotropha endolucinida]|nr:hypothetical protein [Candidatus Thiodiazotropha taylori]MCW4343035.1 hypothetical protein [Candidatus Thiodiazotropha endolucinida]
MSENITMKSEISACASTNLNSSDDNSSLWNVEQDISCDTHAFNDAFEGILYRTHVYESKINISFVSNVLFETFKQKIHSDYMNSVDIDATSFVTKCTTHIKGAKCVIKLDSHFKTVELSGIGFKKWREERFPKIAQSLFKKVMQELDSLVEDPSQNIDVSDQLSEKSFQQDINATITSLGNYVNAPSHDVASVIVAPNDFDVAETGNSTQTVCQQQDILSVASPEFMAENIKSHYCFNANAMTNISGEMNLRQSTCAELSKTSQDLVLNRAVPTDPDQRRRSTTLPISTSTPIVLRQDGSSCDVKGCTSGNICSIINRIDQLDSGIRKIKTEILQQMERKMDELKASVLTIIDSLGPDVSYATAVRTPSSVVRENRQCTSGVNQTTMDSCYVDEGYGDQSKSIDGSSSETELKTAYTPENRKQQERSAALPTPQNVPVRITNRNQQNTRQPLKNNAATAPHRNTANSQSASQNRTLLIGDSILKGINTNGLTSNVKVCTKSGATIEDLWDELSVFDLKSFAQIIVYIGGNDCSNRVDAHIFEEMYDQLIGLIKSENKDCVIHLSKIAPRGDVDVSVHNTSVQRIADHWARQQVNFIEDSHDLFLGINGLPSSRYYSRDGIHLSYSGVKRLLDALNRHVNIVKDFTLCTFQRARFPRKVFGHKPRATGPSNRGSSNNIRGVRYNGLRCNENRVCYCCYMPGHIISECWYKR